MQRGRLNESSGCGLTASLFQNQRLKSELCPFMTGSLFWANVEVVSLYIVEVLVCTYSEVQTKLLAAGTQR